MAYDKVVDSATLDAGLTSVADAIREKGGTSATLAFPQGFVDAIGEISKGEEIPDFIVNPAKHLDENGNWARPSEWPDLDALVLPNDFDGWYLTYDLSLTEDYGWIGIYAKTVGNAAWTVERGSIVNNEFITATSESVANNTKFVEGLDPTNGVIQVWRISCTAGFTQIGFCTRTTVANDNLANMNQPCVERRGKTTHITSPIGAQGGSRNSTNYAHGTYWMEHDNLIHSGAYTGKLSYRDCYNLTKLDLQISSTLVVTDLGSMFSGCYSLQKIDFSEWDTSNWAVTSIGSMFSNCYALISVDFTGLDTNNWAVTNMSSMFTSCRSLPRIDFSPLDTSNWAVTNMSQMFYGAHNLQEVDFSGWDTSNWAVTTLQYLFRDCHNLRSINFSSWDTTNWAVTDMRNAFDQCRNLVAIDFSHWDTTNWAVTDMSSIFSACQRLKSLDLTPWDVSNWEVTNFSSIFYNCYSLQSVDWHTWDTSKWKVSSMSNVFMSAYSIKRIDFSNFDTSGWTVNAWANFTMYGGQSLRYLDVSTIDMNGSSAEMLFGGSYFLEDYYPPKNVPAVNIRMTLAYSLNRASLLRILNALPQTSTTKTITMQLEVKNKLTAEEIAIATNKGWTVA